MEEIQRQFRIALFTFIVVIPVGIFGFMAIEGWSLIDATYVTVITLTTVGYGDYIPKSDVGRIFTIFLLIFGLGSVGFALQAAVGWIASPVFRTTRQRFRVHKKVAHLKHHYIICGMGETVDKTIGYIMQGAEIRRRIVDATRRKPIDNLIDRIFGPKDRPRLPVTRRIVQRIVDTLLHRDNNLRTLLDLVVVVTRDAAYAERLRNSGLLVIEGDPTSDDILHLAGIERAQAMMVILESDTETLLTVLTGHKINPPLHITAGVLDEMIARKLIRVGANSVVNPYNAAGQFLTNATLRPVVNDYFNSILFDLNTDHRVTPLKLYNDSPWVGKRLGDLDLQAVGEAHIIGLRYEDGHFLAVPDDDVILDEGQVLIVVAPATQIETLHHSSRGGNTERRRYIPTFQPLPQPHHSPASPYTYTLVEAENAIKGMSQHFIIVGTNRLAQNIFEKLDPTRPFVLVSNDNQVTNALLKRGFRVIHGDPTSETVLQRAGVRRAQALMVSVDEPAGGVLAILNARAMNKKLLITAAASSDDMIAKLELAGADRVVSPFHVAARFVLLATTRPDIADFFDYVLFNYHTGLETTELYIEDDSPWVGKMLGELNLTVRFESRVIGVRLHDRLTFAYAPLKSHLIRRGEVLIVVTPMRYADELRADAHGSDSKRPMTLRREESMISRTWTQDMLRELLQQRGQS